MAKKVPYYSNDRKLFPMTKTEYVKRGSRWFPVSREQEMISRKQAGYVLDKHGLPFERSHRLEKRDKYRHTSRMTRFRPYLPTDSKSLNGTSIGIRGTKTTYGRRGAVMRQSWVGNAVSVKTRGERYAEALRIGV